MTIAVLNDIHGNRPALEAVLAEVDRSACDRIVVGGDAAFGPMPREVLELLIARGERVQFVRGNCDRDMVTTPHFKIALGERVAARVRWAADHVTPVQRELLAALPLTFETDVEVLGRVLFCHGTPRSEDEIVTSITPERRLGPIYAGVAPRIVVGGHTHAVRGPAWRLLGAARAGRQADAHRIRLRARGARDHRHWLPRG
jgi:predicted phosphodiesterase